MKTEYAATPTKAINSKCLSSTYLFKALNIITVIRVGRTSTNVPVIIPPTTIWVKE
jgi:hypothetical protein